MKLLIFVIPFVSFIFGLNNSVIFINLIFLDTYEEANKLLVDAKELSDLDDFMKDTEQYKKSRKARAKKRMSSASSSSEQDDPKDATVTDSLATVNTFPKPPQLKIVEDVIILPATITNQNLINNDNHRVSNLPDE